MPGSLLVVFACSSRVGGRLRSEVVYDVFGGAFRQQMTIIQAVWSVTALYLGPTASLGDRGRASDERALPERPRPLHRPAPGRVA